MTPLEFPPEVAASAAAAVAAVAADLRAAAGFAPERFDAEGEGGEHFRGTLGWGWPGIALFFAYLYQAHGREEDRELCRRLADLGLEQLARRAVGPSLFHGYTGHAWLSSHLRGWILAGGGADPHATVDRMLVATLAKRPAHLRCHDLLQGLLGIAVYALEADEETRAELLGGLLDALEATAVRSAEGACWHTQPAQCIGAERALHPEGFCSLGLAHGAAGVIAVLSAMAAAGFEPARCRRLTTEAVELVLHHRESRPGGFNFPTYVLKDRVQRVRRAAWCHGDPGIAAALQLAGRRLGRDDWSEIGGEIARQAAELSVEAAGVEDAALCHGAAGLTLLFLRQFELSGDPVLARACCDWAERTLSLRSPGTGVGGFSSRLAGEAPVFAPLPGFLPGAAGIGLVLLRVATGAPFAWDRILLLSSAADRGSSWKAAEPP